LRGDISNKSNSNDFIYEDIGPDETYHVPFYLLESALHLKGNHIGSLWLKPNADDSVIQSLLRGSSTEAKSIQKYVSFCQRPLQLARIVHETALLFSHNQYEEGDMESHDTKLDLSCPIMTDRGVTSSHFSYCLEIRRGLEDHSFDDTLIFSLDHDRVDFSDSSDSPVLKTVRSTDPDASREKVSPDSKHGPVAYSLILHPPIIIENLLPERGRFELMHATRREVLWYGDLAPGESVPIHTVGLDVPLLLLMNLGYCR
jgi:hypothetical protein